VQLINGGYAVDGGNYKKDKVENDDFVKMWCRYMLYGRKKYTSPTPSLLHLIHTQNGNQTKRGPRKKPS